MPPFIVARSQQERVKHLVRSPWAAIRAHKRGLHHPAKYSSHAIHTSAKPMFNGNTMAVERLLVDSIRNPGAGQRRTSSDQPRSTHWIFNGIQSQQLGGLRLSSQQLGTETRRHKPQHCGKADCEQKKHCEPGVKEKRLGLESDKLRNQLTSLSGAGDACLVIHIRHVGCKNLHK